MGLIKRAKDNYFILGGIDSRDFDMVVSCDDAFNMPERDVDTYEVPGRNGDLIVDNGRFQNIDIAYDVVIEKDFPEKINHSSGRSVRFAGTCDSRIHSTRTCIAWRALTR